MGLTTEPFHAFSQELLRQRNADMLPLVVIGHPVGGIRPLQAEALVTPAVVEDIVAALTAGDDA